MMTARRKPYSHSTPTRQPTRHQSSKDSPAYKRMPFATPKKPHTYDLKTMLIHEIKPEKISPVIHLNGNQGKELADEWWTFYESLKNTLDKFPHQSFHGRNHYVKSDTDKQAARESSIVIRESLSDLIEISAEVISMIDDYID